MVHYRRNTVTRPSHTASASATALATHLLELVIQSATKNHANAGEYEYAATYCSID